jgi:hypothetical protein
MIKFNTKDLVFECDITRDNPNDLEELNINITCSSTPDIIYKRIIANESGTYGIKKKISFKETI